MLLEMSLQISFLTGSVRTSRKWASKGFFTTMDTLMDDETDLLCEGVGATRIGTFEGAVSSMCSHMDYDIRLSCGAVVTAFKWTVIFGDLIGLLLHWTLHGHQDGCRLWALVLVRFDFSDTWTEVMELGGASSHTNRWIVTRTILERWRGLPEGLLQSLEEEK